MENLSQLSLQELWLLFPIRLTEPQEAWPSWYEEEKKQLEQILNEKNLRFHHIGSTAIRGIWAKPIIDILIEVQTPSLLKTSKNKLVKQGYICMTENDNRIVLNKGYSKSGLAQKVYHIHIHLLGDNDEVYFRDYLNAFPEIAKDYESLKLGLWKKFEFDRDEYTRQKTEFVNHYTQMAKEWFSKTR